MINRLLGNRAAVGFLLGGILLAGVTFVSPLAAQSLTSAGLRGLVRDSHGQPLYQVNISIIEQSSGVRRGAASDRAGRFGLSPMRPGSYDVLAEAVGYRPKRVRNVPVFPGNEIEVGITLEAAPPPVIRIDTVLFSGTAINGRGNGMSQRFSAGTVHEFADERRDVTGELRHASNATGDEVEGFPAAEPTIMIDGVPFVPARNPAVISRTSAGLVLPLIAVDRAELATNPLDVEWAQFSAGMLSADTHHGTNDWHADVFGDWAGRPTSSSKFFQPENVAHNTWRSGGMLSGPLIRDTAGFAIGVEHREVEAPFPAIAGTNSAAAIVALANATSGKDFSAYRTPFVNHQATTAGFARVDWQIAPNHLVTSRVNVGKLDANAPDFGMGFFQSLGSQLKGTDLSAAATLTSRISDAFHQDFRVGFSESRREYLSSPVPSTVIVGQGLALGSDPALPGLFKRTDVFISDAVHLAAGRHAFKLGLQGNIGIIDDSYAFGHDPHFVFADSAHLAQRQGLFWQTGGPAPNAKFSLPTFAGYVQDAWTVAPGLRVTGGARVDYERLPVGKVTPNDSLFLATGLINTLMPSRTLRITPRFGFVWDAASRGDWIIRGAAGLYSQPFDPSSLSEVITTSSRVNYRSELGTLPSWPGAPDNTAAPVRGRDVTLFGPSLTAPRETHFTLGISRSLGKSAALHLSGTYRHSDFLLRRHDLNILLAPSTSDAVGRPIYGTLQQMGSQLAAVPGSNIRFNQYNRIWALDPDGFSDYRGVTVGLERASPAGLRLLATYTYSKTRDNWLSRPGLDPLAQVTPFASGLNNVDWAEGTADFDVPHHVSIGVALPEARRFLGMRLSALYSYRTGYPFTPSFRQGVDANGDGSAGNDPAYVNESIAGTSDLFGTWDCLRSQSGHFAERNSCRSKGLQRLDLRLTFAPIRSAGLRGELVIDALNVLDSEESFTDAALYLVDGSQTMTAGANGVITVPLVVNPNFGQPLLRLTSGKSLRIGLRLTR